MSVVYPCIVCESNITGRSHAIQCDVCNRWQHRKCNTGVTHIQYRQLQRKEITLDWSCGRCRSVETRNDDDDVQPPSPQTSPPCETLELPPRPHIPDLMQDDEPTRIPDTSFNVSGDIGSLPMIQDEELEDRPPSPVDAPDGPVTYEVLEGGTRIGARMLLGSDGFTYNVKRENKSTGFIYWVCSVRSKANRCPAWVKEYGASRVSDYIPHNHPADPTKAGKLRTSVLAKTKAAASLSRPAGQVVKEALRELKDVNAKPSNVTRAVNRHRQGKRPKDPLPDELDFEIQKEYLDVDNFLLDDIKMDGARHIMFSTPDQLQHLKRARRWFIDGTFKVVSRPFYQLII